MFSNIDDAFNNSLSNQIKVIDEENQNKINNLQKQVYQYQSSNNLSSPYDNDQNDQTEYNIIQNNNIHSYNNGQSHNNGQTHNNVPYINAQGDITEKNMSGTYLYDLESKSNNSLDLDSESNSLFDSESLSFNLNTNNSLNSLDNSINKQPKVVFSHDYYIKKYIKQFIIDEPMSLSLSSNNSNDIFEHVSKCKYCKNEIKKYFKNKSKTNELAIKEESELTNFTNNFKSDIKDIIVIIVIGLIIIFILDLFYKIGKNI